MNYQTSYLPEDRDLEEEGRRRALTSLQTMDGGMGAPVAPTPPVAPAPAPAPSPAPDAPSAAGQLESYLSRLGNARQEVDALTQQNASMAPAIQRLAQDSRRRDPVEEQRSQALINGTDALSQQSRYQAAERDASGRRTRNTVIGAIGTLLGARPEALAGLAESNDRPITEFLARRRQELAEQGVAQAGQDRARTEATRAQDRATAQQQQQVENTRADRELGVRTDLAQTQISRAQRDEDLNDATSELSVGDQAALKRSRDALGISTSVLPDSAIDTMSAATIRSNPALRTMLTAQSNTNLATTREQARARFRHPHGTGGGGRCAGRRFTPEARRAVRAEQSHVCRGC